MRVSRKISIYRAQRSQQGCSLSLGMLRLAEPPTGRARLRSSLKSPRNPITPIETSRVATLHPGLYKNLREDARRVIGATAKPLYPIDGKAVGLDRRSPSRPPSSREGDRRSGGRSLRTVEGVPTISVDFLFSVRKQLNLVSVFCPTGERRIWASIGYAPRRRGSTGRWANESEHTREE